MKTILIKVGAIITTPLKLFLNHPWVRNKLIFSDVINAHPDEIMLKNALEFAAHANLAGDYLEFGVWKGRSFARAFNIWKWISKNSNRLKGMKFYAFDSFAGLPEITSAEDKATGEFTKGQYSCSEDEFKKIIAGRGVDLNKVITTKGWYDKILNNETKQSLGIKSAAIIFIDSDLYDSAVSVLNFITDYVEDGTILIFDDWFCFKGDPAKGEQKAFAEWLARNPQLRETEYQKFNWKGNSFIMHKN
ncbi:hypothetical protein A3I35_02060 [Candidatus Falkowbacteria bacterium RIFCSPLOWO2_02_FULL_45_15]|uniref:Methyltransferase n=2 Tax=Candidatus Falkowiibacteriota TaxID=1752728 RepID=A0A1F5RJX4_9BACT|nr:MAG: hypothetical protein A3D54_01725 [Candidatus Falkowbacteria bacterium RIFCSPHIGHO2_02_FULL_45_15]OGF19609.1 MAG: hypothetical protein A3I35_02060 [Candidatus Falkowbacteria bacterium RIFCSPLOWO2_02_FULL_45_15]